MVLLVQLTTLKEALFLYCHAGTAHNFEGGIIFEQAKEETCPYALCTPPITTIQYRTIYDAQAQGPNPVKPQALTHFLTSRSPKLEGSWMITKTKMMYWYTNERTTTKTEENEEQASNNQKKIIRHTPKEAYYNPSVTVFIKVQICQ